MRLNKGVTSDFYKDEEKNKQLLHEISLKLIPTTINHDIWEIRYTYKTKRGNKKENHKYVIGADSTSAKLSFLDYINTFNTINPYRALSNVKILETTYKGTIKQSY